MIGALLLAAPPGVAGSESYTPATRAVLQQAADSAAADSAPADTIPAAADTIPAAAADTVPEGLDDFVSDFTDLGVRFRGRMEMGGEWTRFRPCDVRLDTTCEPSLFPQLRPDVQFGLDVGGSISERVHVDVDYDESREFSATNNVNVYYQGRQGELLQRLEVGDVSFQLPRSRFLTQGIPAGNFGFRADARVGGLDVETIWAEQNGDIETRTLRIGGVGDAVGRPRLPGPDGGGPGGAGGVGASPGAGVTPGFVQDDTLVVDDADYVRGQFFFLVDPDELDGYPHVDVLGLTPSDAPPSVTPGPEPVRLYRFEGDPVVRQQVEGYIQAMGVAGEGGDRVQESGWFRYLQPGVDYVVHSSGLWITLRRPLTRDEMLAVTYVTATGDTVGTYDAEDVYNAGERPTLELLKASGPEHRPGRPTWEREMHQVYRVSGSTDVDPASVDLTISLGELSGGETFKEGPDGREITFLRLFGMDEQSPFDVVDRPSLYVPGEEYLLDPPPVSGVFLVFPTLEPFRQPPPVPSEGLTAEEAALVLGADANEAIYTNPDFFERREGGLFRLTIPFRIQGSSGLSTFSLGALGVRDGSERIYLGDRLLVRGVHYTIDYTVGQVILLDPDALFAGRPGAEIRATWEQKQVFRLAPTSVGGVRASTEIGGYGTLDFLGLYQQEDALVNRPILGVEPAAITLGGVNTDLAFGAAWMDRALDALPGLRRGGESSVQVRGELAVSSPDPNTQGAVYIDDFDGSESRSISLETEEWMLGSAPESRVGAEAELPAAIDLEHSASLVWQHRWVLEGASGDSVGVFEGFLPRQDIDRQINVVGSQRREPGLLLTFAGGGTGEESGPAGGGPGGPGGPRNPTGEFGGDPLGDVHWRSITTLLAPQGMDLSRTEFIEFYVAQGDSLTLVLDLGLVSEDAFFVDPEGRVNGIKPSTGEPWGLGFLDQEADPRQGEIWSDVADLRGVWDEGCLAERARIYRIGDPRANCTRGNGVRDTEDLDENGSLNQNERYLRYTITLDGSSPFLVRTREETGTSFRLFRIPIGAGDGVPVGGFSPEVDLRAVEHLRMTVAGDQTGSMILARMRMVGSRWVKRLEEGVLEGIVGLDPALGGTVEVGPVSRLSVGAAYSRPPGIAEELDDPALARIGEGVEFQEQALSIRYDGVGPGERAEVFTRYPQRPRDFLTYRSARLWAVARRGEWGADEPVYIFLKVGSDSRNFYIFRKRLTPAVDPDAVRPADWAPEIVVDLGRWMRLRSRAEEALATRGAAVEGGASGELVSPIDSGASGDLAGLGVPEGSVAVWSADSTYAVVLQDRGRAPNLASVREVSVGVWNQSGAPVSGEVWVNELRLSDGFGETGSGAYAEVDFAAGELVDARVSYARSGAFFRQLETGPSYQDDRDLRITTTTSLDRFAPEEWGLRAPLLVQHSRSRRSPFLLRESDLEARLLPNLRTPEEERTRVSVAFRRELVDEPDGALETLVSDMEIGAGVTRTRSQTVTTEAAGRSLDAFLGYGSEPRDRSVPVVPAPAEGVVEALLPGFLETRLLAARLRWSPERISLRTAYFRRSARTYRFQQIVRLPADENVVPIRSPRESLEAGGFLGFQPFRALGYDLDLLSLRDLLAPADAVADPAIRPLVRAEHVRALGMDLGWETARTLRTRLEWRPELFDWLGTRLLTTTYYGSLRDPSMVQRDGGISLGWPGAPTALQRSVNGRRDIQVGLSLDPGAMVGSAEGVGAGGGVGGGDAGGADGVGGGDADTDAGGAEGDASLVARVLRSLERMTLDVEDGITSRFNRQVVDPGGGLQLGWGGLDDYRVQDGDTASLLVDRASLRAGAGVQLPLNLSVRVAYSELDSRSVDIRSVRRMRRQSWPDVTVRLQEVPLPEAVERVLARVTVGSGLRLTQQRLTFGRAGEQLRIEETVQVPADVSLTWSGGLVSRYRASFEEGRGLDPTGLTDRNRVLHAVTLSARFLPPGEWGENLERPIQLTMGWQLTDERNCRVATGRVDCVPFVDQRNRSVYLTLDTQVQRLEIGLQSSWVDRQSYVGRHAGSTQFQLGLFGEFQFTAGDLSRL